MENKENQDKRGLGLLSNQKSQKPAPKGKSWFFGIGINNYSAFSNLNNAVNDIEAIQQLLTEKYDIESDCTISILNEDATRENIIDQLDVLVKKVKAEDKLIIYYSGHGHLDKNTDRGYWIPHNAKIGKTAHYIRNSTIREFIKDLKARHVLLISDSCFSGTLFVRGANRSTAAVGELEAIPSRWAICSGRHDEEVYDGKPGENSPFATSILETLSRNEKPIFNIAKLADRVVEQTRSNYKQLPEGNPLYDVGHKGGQYVFHLKKDEVADWKECVEKGSILAFNTFLLKYPEGKYAPDAKKELKSLKAAELWQKIEKAAEETPIEVNKKLQLINQFIKQYDDQAPYGRALDLGELLDYKKQFIQAKSSEYALRKFLRLNIPKVDGANEIFEEAKQLLVKFELPVIKEDEKAKLAEIERLRLEKAAQPAKQQKFEKDKKTEEELLAKQKAAEQRLKEQSGLTDAEQQKEEALRQQRIKQQRKYSLFASLVIVGIIAVFFIVRAMIGTNSEPTSTTTKTEMNQPDEELNSKPPAKTKTDLPDMVFIQGGTFQMGDQFGDGDDNEELHSVTVSDYYLSNHEVTFGEYAEYCKAEGKFLPDDQGWGKGNRPVINVSWNDVVAYCNWKSDQSGLQKVYTISSSSVTANWDANGYRLPTEAEWEYAARSRGKKEKWAGTSSESVLTKYSNDSGTDDGHEFTAPVKSFQPNGLGLYDMSGNVWEWCWDWYGSNYYANSKNASDPRGPVTGSSRVFRGGSWLNSPRRCRAARRGTDGPTFRFNYFGFRLASSSR